MTSFFITIEIPTAVKSDLKINKINKYDDVGISKT